MITKTFGSDEGFEAVHEAMLQYLSGRSINGEPRTHYHTSWNLSDMTQLLNALQMVIETPVHKLARFGPKLTDLVTPETLQEAQATKDWAERMYRDIATTVGVELI